MRRNFPRDRDAEHIRRSRMATSGCCGSCGVLRYAAPCCCADPSQPTQAVGIGLRWMGQHCHDLNDLRTSHTSPILRLLMTLLILLIRRRLRRRRRLLLLRPTTTTTELRIDGRGFWVCGVVSPQSIHCDIISPHNHTNVVKTLTYGNLDPTERAVAFMLK